MNNEKKYQDRSVLIHGRFRSEKWDFQDHITPPITTSTAFRLRSAERGAQGFQQFANPDLDRNTASPIYIYERLDDPCQGLLEETLAFAEKGETAVSYATGMAAISAVLGIHLKAGDHLIANKTIYGCTYSLVTKWLSRFGIQHSFIDLKCPQALAEAIQPNTKVVYFETPSNPNLDLIDIRQVVDVVQKANENRSDDERVVTVIDNTFATPFCQRPLTLGADFVVHSLTKNLNGFGTEMGGVVIGPKRAETDLLVFRKDFGGTISPKTAWHILTYGIPTLSLRVERQQETARKVAEFLELHPRIDFVRYPSLDSFPQKELALRQLRDIDGNFAPGYMIYFGLKGNPEEAYSRAINLLNDLAERSLSITLAVSLGQIRTLIEHPASMTHSAIAPEDQADAGIDSGGVRLSIGLEDSRDILSDLGDALKSL